MEQKTQPVATGRTGYHQGRYYQAGITGVIGYLGLPGTGKTTRAIETFWNMNRLVIYNTAGDFGEGEGKKSLPGFQYVFSVPALVEILRASRHEQWPQLRLCFTPIGCRDLNGQLVPKVELFSDVCRIVRDHGKIAFLVDEIWNFQTAGSSPEELEECMLQWRHYGLTFGWTAQIAQKVDKTLISVSTQLYCGRLTAENDIENVRRHGRLPEKAIAMLPNLHPLDDKDSVHEFIHRFENGDWRIERS